VKAEALNAAVIHNVRELVNKTRPNFDYNWDVLILVFFSIFCLNIHFLLTFRLILYSGNRINLYRECVSVQKSKYIHKLLPIQYNAKAQITPIKIICKEMFLTCNTQSVEHKYFVHRTIAHISFYLCHLLIYNLLSNKTEFEILEFLLRFKGS
jgi:hypothetical protein